MCDSRKLDKIRNLLATADKRRNSNDHEAFNALKLAQKLMAKWGIESSDLEEISRDETDIIHIACEHKWDMGYRKYLACIIADNYRCKAYIHGGVVMFIGVRDDAFVAKSAFEFAYRFIMRAGNKEYENTRKQGYSGKGVFNSYALGFLKGLKEVLSAQSVALMIVTPATVTQAFESLELKEGSGGVRADGIYKDVYDKGYTDAKDQYGRKALSGGTN